MKVIGVGNTAEVIELEDKRVCKLFYEDYPSATIKREYKNARIMKSLGVHVPGVYDIINVGQRSGIIYDKIQGELFLEVLLRGGDALLLIEKFVKIHKNILENTSKEVLPYKEFLKLCIGEKTKETLDLYKEIDSLPEGNCLCHGDFHPGNVILDNSENAIVIDFMNVCYGPYEYDVARTYFLISEGDVPRDVPNRGEIISMQKQLAELYLNNIGVSHEAVSKYISVIQKCRKYE